MKKIIGDIVPSALIPGFLFYYVIPAAIFKISNL